MWFHLSNYSVFIHPHITPICFPYTNYTNITTEIIFEVLETNYTNITTEIIFEVS